jgi:NAD(P)-dependent dehydrogenase (short-subunit alcohol dehydrogenase family)
MASIHDSSHEGQMAEELSGTATLVTGGTSGIGRATSVGLARNGPRVALSGRDQERGNEVVRQIVAAGGRAEFLAADLRDEASARSLAERAISRLGVVDVPVNNAGIYPFGPTSQTREADFDSVFALNVKVPYFLVARLAPEMAKRGHGAIINVTTMVAEFGMTGMGLYGASKAALALLTKSWAAEYGPEGVRVNAVSPGPIRTEGTAEMGDNLDQLAAAGPAGRPALPRKSQRPSCSWPRTGRASFTARSCQWTADEPPYSCRYPQQANHCARDSKRSAWGVEGR